jgi:hypothetical protein
MHVPDTLYHTTYAWHSQEMPIIIGGSSGYWPPGGTARPGMYTCVLLDTYYDDIEATRQHETAWRMLITMAEKVLDLPRETLR